MIFVLFYRNIRHQNNEYRQSVNVNELHISYGVSELLFKPENVMLLPNGIQHYK